jgi:hypothetical protein
MTHRGVLVIGVVLWAVGGLQAQSAPLNVVLERVAGYLLDYETKVFELVAEEEYSQWIKRRPGYGQDIVARRKLNSTYFLVRLPDGQAWYGFRDVGRVDGKTIAREGPPMADLLSERTIDAVEEALAVTRANAKYNIGGVYRTLNVPLQALELFSRHFQQRFDFHDAGRERVSGLNAAVLGFRERSAPSVITDGFGGDVLSQGRVWVDPPSGAVLRTELRFYGPATSYLKENFIRVDFERDSRLQLLLPREMEETYGLDVEVVHGRAPYRNYRRFETGGRLVTPD